MLIQIKVEENESSKMKIKKNECGIAKVTYKSLGLVENALEEFLQENIEILTQEEDYELKIIGKQVRDNSNKRTDLVGVDSNGNVVIIEIKRDADDMKIRRDNFESQAIRYAASFAKINSIEELVEKVHAEYLIRYMGVEEEKAVEQGITDIYTFLKEHGTFNDFNADQRIILVASSFEPSVLSASAWLLTKGVDISCFEIAPQLIERETGNEYLLEIKKLLPLGSDDDYFSEIIKSENKRPTTRKRKSGGSRMKFPKLSHMVEVGLVSEGDDCFYRNKEEESKAKIYGGNNVEFNGKIISLNEWASQFVTGGKINAYEYCIVKEKNKTLAELRVENKELFYGMGFDSIYDI
ncbi:hypothetical protein NGI46_28060 [Peribacillus butanolivorans]|uniref:hypothetical protein n=2 Tax=Peribacillus TaxID=2675229 RepID=UPI00207D450E|nr:hypothetical protein [Peribacillus butanolivorans]MCO0601159.1 hypothetical protein [Peribacillus butanolivorans]